MLAQFSTARPFVIQCVVTAGFRDPNAPLGIEASTGTLLDILGRGQVCGNGCYAAIVGTRDQRLQLGHYASPGFDAPEGALGALRTKRTNALRSRYRPKLYQKSAAHRDAVAELS